MSAGRTHRPARGPARRELEVADKEYMAVSEGRIRIRIGLVLFLSALALGILRLAEVSLLTPGGYYTDSQIQPPAIRADIVDRNGDVMATTLTTYAMYARKKYIWNAEKSARRISEVLPKYSAAYIHDRLTRPGDEIQIARGLTPKEQQALFALGVPGLTFREESQRVYPRRDLASHIVGYANVDMQGLAGTEKALDSRLLESNAPPLALSIDMKVQHALEDELQRGFEKFKAKSNAGVVLNIKTGEIVALASRPGFDANTPATASPHNKYNHASMSTYDLGSVFKPLTMAMALESGVTNLTEEFPVQKPLKVRDKFIRDDHPSQVPLAMPEILAESSNRGTAMMAQRLGGDRQRDYLKALGLMDRVPFELHESAAPQLQSEWQDITTVTVSYGHGISVTPLALAVATGAILNGGEYIAPTILKRDPSNPIEKHRVFSAQTSQTMRDLMRYVVTNGTGRNARVRGYDLMGKTGTADKPSNGSYDESRLVSSFVAAFPYTDPTYVVMITYDEPKAIEGTYGYATAGWNAAPTAGKVVERIAPMLGVPRKTGDVTFSPFSEEELLR